FDTCGGAATVCGSVVEADLVGGTSVIAVLDGIGGVDGGFAMTVFEGGSDRPEGLCVDGYDNDLDGGTDCDDLDCAADPSCIPDCADEGIPAPPATVSGDTTGGADDEDTCGFGTGAPDRAFSFTAPADGRYGFTLSGADGFDTTLAVKTGGCAETSYYCLDQIGASGEAVPVSLEQGDTLVLVVDGVNGASGAFDLAVTLVPEVELACADGGDEDFDGQVDCADPDCDSVCFEDCANGVDDDLDGRTDCTDSTCTGDLACEPTCPNSEFTDTLSASTDGQPDGATSACGFPGAPDYSAAFTAPTDGRYQFSLSSTGTAFDSTLSVYDTCFGIELDCADAWSPTSPYGGEALEIELVAGQQVVLVVDGWSSGSFGAFELTAMRIAEAETTCADGLDEDLDGATDCADSECLADPACTGLVEVTWSNEVVAPGCFTFSSPSLLGTAAVWTDDGAAATLDFVGPTWPAVFSGTWAGSDLTLVSVELFPYVIELWQVTETLTTSLTGSTLAGTYTYTECNSTGDPASCPADGGCTVSADFSLELP
ncbi:MAG: hypothetical protein ABMA64_42195, partial [Myxococcota bacterium]